MIKINMLYFCACLVSFANMIQQANLISAVGCLDHLETANNVTVVREIDVVRKQYRGVSELECKE